MTVNLYALATVIATCAVVYLLHSTCLSGGAWLITRLKHVQAWGPAASERIWKTATIAALCTTGVQMCWPATAVRTNAIASNPPLVAAPMPTDEHEYAAALETPRGGMAAPALETGDSTSESHIVTVESSSSATLSGPASPEPATTLPVAKPPATAAAVPGPAIAPRAGLAVAAAEKNSDRQACMVWAAWLIAAAAVPAIMLGLLRVVLQSVLFCWRLRRATPLRRGNIPRLLKQLLQSNNIRRNICLLESDEYLEPVAFGIFHWTILVPRGAGKRLPEEELTALLAHELAHLVRGDAWWLWVGRLFCNCLAFQPLNHIARRYWREASEQLCDDWAVRHGANHLSLAHCLTEIAQWKLAAQSCPVTLAASGSTSILTTRVHRLVERNHAPKVPFAGSVLLVAAAVTGVLILSAGPRVFAFPPSATAVVSAAAGAPETSSSFEEAALSHSSAETESGAAPSARREAIARELADLEAELSRLAALLETLPADAEIQRAASGMQLRADALRKMLAAYRAGESGEVIP